MEIIFIEIGSFYTPIRQPYNGILLSMAYSAEEKSSRRDTSFQVAMTEVLAWPRL